MGSGTTKKLSDTPRLRSTAVGTGGPASGNSEQNLCPEQFNIPFNHASAVLFAGRQVTVVNTTVKVDQVELFNLSASRKTLLEKCGDQGVDYTGVVIEHKNKYYVHFSRRDT